MSMNTSIQVSRLVNLVADHRFHSARAVSHNLKKILDTMPKEVKHTAALQKQRQKLKEKNQKYIPGTVTLKVLGSGAKGAPRSLYVFTDQSRYLFNCGEGTQRLAHEHRMKLSKLEHIFITHRSWENIGGLLGVALTIQDVGVPEVTVHGPLGTDEIFKATRRFVILRDLSVKMANCSPPNYFEDNVMKVFYVPIEPMTVDAKNGSSDSVSCRNSVVNESLEEDDIDYYAYERKNKISSTSEKAPRKQQRADVANTQSSKLSGAAMCYICRLQPRPGTLNLESCVERGVPPGPLLGKLKSGEDVVLSDGTVVYSADVRQPDDPGPIFIVVECPTVEYIENMVNDPLISKHQSTAEKEDDLAALIVHFSPQNVLDDPRYRNWMEKFSMSTQHLILNDENRCMGSVAVHRIQYKLNLLHPNLFPLLGDKSIKIDESQTVETEFINDRSEQVNGGKKMDSSVYDSSSVSSYHGKTFASVHLRPRKMWDRQGELTLTPKLFIDETCETEEFSKALSELKQEIKKIEQNIVMRDSDPKISFLGTGSCIPNKTRNTSGILLHISNSESILLDCGEGTYGQIVRLFGPEKADSVLLGIKSIFVSHLHADHHLGLIGLLKARRKALEKCKSISKPIFLIAPQQIMSWLSLYHWNFEPVTQEILLVPNAHLNLKEPTINEEVKKRVLETLNMEDINTVLVKHCPNAFGIAFKHKDNWKLTYSGDTMPCSQLVDLGQGSDVLIHEATMEDELVDEARIKLHSTTSQAIEVGQKMKAKFILLTHFSQRYAKIPRINENFSQNVGIAFDNMQVSFSQLPLLPLLHPALKIMFAEHYDEMEQKTFRRLMKLEREKEGQKT